MKTKILLCLMFLTAAFFPANGSESERRNHPARGMWEELNLTAEQEAQFREVNARHAPMRREHAQRIEDLRGRINQELLKDRPSRSLLAQYAGQMGEIQKRMNIESVNHFLNVKAILTPEQFKIFTDRVSVGSPSGGRRRDAGGRPGIDYEDE